MCVGSCNFAKEIVPVTADNRAGLKTCQQTVIPALKVCEGLRTSLSQIKSVATNSNGSNDREIMHAASGTVLQTVIQLPNGRTVAHLISR